jgi:hypothetical protein
VYVPGGLDSDGDTNLVIAPVAAHRGLINCHGRRNRNSTMECEVNVTHSIAHFFWKPVLGALASLVVHITSCSDGFQARVLLRHCTPGRSGGTAVLFGHRRHVSHGAEIPPAHSR